MENNNKHLVAAGREFAETMSDDTPLIAIAKMMARLSEELDVQTARSEALAAELKKAEANDADARCHVAELEARCEALAAENAALNSFGDKLNEMHNDLNGEGTGIQGRAEVVIQQISLEAAIEEFDAIETPATDAFLAEVRAQGVEMFAALERKLAAKHASTIDTSSVDYGAARADDFAQQLRDEVKS